MNIHQPIFVKFDASVLAILPACLLMLFMLVIIGAYVMAGPMHAAVPSLVVAVPLLNGYYFTPRFVWRMTAGALFILAGVMACMSTLQPLDYPATQEALHFFLVSGMTCAMTLYIKHCSAVRDRLLQQKSELTQALSHIHSLAIRDELTQLPNRLHMRELLEHESHRHRREGQTLCLAMLDLDLFKRINDRYGHQTGDEVLRQFASNASAVLRVTDVLARWGGEEFFLFMPNTSPQAALQVLERMRGRIANLHFPAIDPALQLTFSGGLTVLGPDEQIELAIKRADSALYQVKANGRNAVRLFENDAFDRINMT